jgi:CHAD domain-containing protein
MNLVVLAVVASTSITADTGYVGVYRDMDQCKEMQDIYLKHLDPTAIMVCDTVTRFQPVLIPPPRPAGLKRP